MFYWIYDYPSWAMGLLFVGLFVGLTWAGILLTRRVVRHWLHRSAHTNDMVGLTLSSYFVLYGLLLGLLAVATYQNYTAVDALVDQEASALAALYRDFGGYPEPARTALRDGLRDYTRYTVQVRREPEKSADSDLQAAERAGGYSSVRSWTHKRATIAGWQRA